MTKPMPEKKEPPFRLMKFVQVPRLHVPFYANQSWADVVLAASREEDGLTMVHGNFFSISKPVPDVALLREGPTGGCLLFQQNWCDETNDKKWRHVP
ncbi:MAG TPA: hypothetical protein VMR92_08525 [Gemmatimonadales bacterium]|nr:hypothetical protein [Gemmatimonadales bacterium]